jgi:hypothetical protein
VFELDVGRDHVGRERESFADALDRASGESAAAAKEL